MKLCLVAIAVGCKKCPVFKVCPLKGSIGDYTPPEKPAGKGVDAEQVDTGKDG